VERKEREREAEQLWIRTWDEKTREKEKLALLCSATLRANWASSLPPWI